MKGYALVVLGLLALFGRIGARPQDETTTSSEQVKKGDEVEEKKDDQSKTGEDSTTTSTVISVEEKSSEKSGESDTAEPKVKRATDEALTQERTLESSTEGNTTTAPVDEGKPGGSEGHEEKDAKSAESTEIPKIEGKEENEEKSAAKGDDHKSDDHVNERSGIAERTGAAESKENKESVKEEPKSAAEVSTSTEVVRQRSAYSSSSILETKGRSGESGDSDTSDFKGRAHMNVRVPPVNPLGVINNINEIGSRRMDQPNLMLNIPQHFPPPIHQMLPKTLPSQFNTYLNPAPSIPNLANMPNLAQDRRGYNEYRPETNAYPYSPTSSQQADSLSKFPSLRDLPKLPSYPSNFYKPYDQNFSSNFGARPRRYTVASVPDTMNAYTNFGYPHYIR